MMEIQRKMNTVLKQKWDALDEVVFDASMPPHLTSKSLEKYGEAIRACTRTDCIHMTVTQIARKYHLSPDNLYYHLNRHFPQILRQRKAYRQIWEEQKLCDKFKPVADYILTHPSKTLEDVARKWNCPEDELVRMLSTYYPEIWERFCRAGKLSRSAR